jgi:hypothetical protein
VLRHRLGVIGAVLTLAGALIAVLALVLPATATGGRPGGKNEVWYYTNAKGNVIQKAGEDQDFNIIGKNLDHAVEVYCFADGQADDGTDLGDWDTVTDWSYGPTSKSLVDVDADPDCGSTEFRSAIIVQFDNKTPGDESDDIFVQGPPIQFKPEP